jgi:hypothetical protein
VHDDFVFILEELQQFLDNDDMELASRSCSMKYLATMKCDGPWEIN